jgi:short-subunit dehydrogenase
MLAKTLWITGASRGIGEALAREFAQRGHAVMLSGRNIDRLHQIVSHIRNEGGQAECIRCDVTNMAEVRTAIEATIDRFGPIDIAILNAGTSGSVRFSNFDRGLYDTILSTNISGTVNGLEALIPVMKRQGYGTIVGISSLADQRPIPGTSPYIASKAAMSILLEGAALELKPLGINVIIVRPGFVATDMTAGNRMPMPFLMSANRAAKIITRRVLKGHTTISFPLLSAIGSSLSGLIPAFLWRSVFRVRRSPDDR